MDRRFADRRIFPAIDIEKSGTRHEELLFDKENYQKHMTLRRMLSMLNADERLAVMIEKLQKVKTNQEFLDSLSGNNVK